MTNALIVIGMVVVTWGVRALPFMIKNITLPAPLLRVLNGVPAAVLAALIAVPIIEPVSSTGDWLQPELLAALVCLGFGIIGSPLLLTVVAGMASFWLFGILL